MSDERERNINFLDPVAGSPEIEADFETAETNLVRPTDSEQTNKPTSRSFSRSNILPAASLQPTSLDKDPVLLEIENILSANLLEIYNELPENKREAFKLKGEEVASKIHAMILDAKLKIHKILTLISDWLHMVPGINVYFLQQEAKIKLDKIVAYAHEHEKLTHTQV